MDVEIARLSSKGQLVVPLSLRRRLRTKEGTRFLIFARDDTIILKKVREEAAENWEEQTRTIRKKARALGITRKDIEEEIRAARDTHRR